MGHEISYCPDCGAKQPRPDARFCLRCGAALAALVAPAPRDADPVMAHPGTIAGGCIGRAAGVVPNA